MACDKGYEKLKYIYSEDCLRDLSPDEALQHITSEIGFVQNNKVHLPTIKDDTAEIEGYITCILNITDMFIALLLNHQTFAAEHAQDFMQCQNNITPFLVELAEYLYTNEIEPKVDDTVLLHMMLCTFLMTNDKKWFERQTKYFDENDLAKLSS